MTNLKILDCVILLEAKCQCNSHLSTMLAGNYPLFIGRWLHCARIQRRRIVRIARVRSIVHDGPIHREEPVECDREIHCSVTCSGFACAYCRVEWLERNKIKIQFKVVHQSVLMEHFSKH